MTFTRRTQFGRAITAPPTSQYTVRMVPLTQGLQLDQPWMLPPGSTTSLTNYLPLDSGRLVPRSRLSSLNSVRVLDTIIGMAPYVGQANVESVWMSAVTTHAEMFSNGSVSRASFISAGGLGVAALDPTVVGYEYAQVFMAGINDNVLIAADTQSNQSLLVLYGTTGGLSAPRYSFLTGAPMAGSVAVSNAYVVAFNINTGSLFASTRVQWCARGSPSGWTVEGSGLEDLLDMRGNGNAVRAMADGRIILFSGLEIWYGLPAPYPSQWQFAALDTSVGCNLSRTIVQCDDGLLFLGSDGRVRLLPVGGGASRPISQSVAEITSKVADQGDSWASYDPIKKHYHLFMVSLDNTTVPLVLNTVTGAWGYMAYNTPTPTAGFGRLRTRGIGGSEELYWANSTGTVYSSNSKIALENGSVVTSTYRSAPIATDLPGNWKQITQVDVDHRSTSTATLFLKISQDGGNTYESVGRSVTLPIHPVSGRARSQMYVGGAFPAVEVASSSTGYELHRLDISMNIGGRA